MTDEDIKRGKERAYRARWGAPIEGVTVSHTVEQQIQRLRQLGGALNEAVTILNTEIRHLKRERRMAELDAEAPAAELPVPESGTELDEHRRSVVVATALREWQRGVCEPNTPGVSQTLREASRQRIDTYIRGKQGLDWTSGNTKHLGKPIPYRKDGDFSWCGAFAAWCYGHAGLKHELRQKVLPSCRRLFKWAEGTDRFVDFRSGGNAGVLRSLEPGDLLIVGRKGSRYGDHIVVLLSDLTERRGSAGTRMVWDTVEGNATGPGPLERPTTWEGVIKRERPLDRGTADEYAAHFGVCFRAEDFE